MKSRLTALRTGNSWEHRMLVQTTFLVKLFSHPTDFGGVLTTHCD